MSDDIANADDPDGALDSILGDPPKLMNLHFCHFFDDIGEGEVGLNADGFEIGFCG